MLAPEEYRVARLKMEGFSDREVGRILGKAPAPWPPSGTGPGQSSGRNLPEACKETGPP